MKIRDIEIIELRYPGWTGETFDGSYDNCVVLVHTDGGVTGIAEVDSVPSVIRAIVDANLAALGVLEHISFSISLDDVAEGKPDPEPYLQACTRLHLDPASVIAIEDSRSGALSARRAGLTVIGYTATGGGFDEADHLIADFSQFMDQQQPWWR